LGGYLVKKEVLRLFMKEKTLFKIALLCTIVGVVVLFFFSKGVKIDETTIDRINVEDVDKQVTIKGVVTKVIDLESVMILEVTQPSAITVVLFKEEGIDIMKGDDVEVTGKIEEYQGKPELIGNVVVVK